MKKSMIHGNKLIIFFVSLFVFFWFFTSSGSVNASDVSVSAKIPDTEPPSVPILIEPTDGALLSDSTPSFKWYESTDNMMLSHYVFYLSGAIAYNNIPLVDTETSDYVLDYDELNGIYTLTPKNALSDRTYSWQVVAVDYMDLKSASDTWYFTIDTLAPSFVLSQIGDTAVNISAGDAGSVPETPIIIFKDDATANEPILIAYGEAASTVQLTVTIPDDATQVFNKQIDVNGYYELQLGILPRSKDIRLDFIITDQVGHVSVLEGVYFRIELQYWPTATPTPTTTTTVTPTPTATVTSSPTPTISPTLSVTTSISPTVSVYPSLSPTITSTPTVSSPIPTGLIPIIPPKEIVHEIGDELIETLPEPTASNIRTFLRSQLWQDLSKVMALLLLGVFYLLAFLVILSKFIDLLSLKLLKRMAVLLFPSFFKPGKNLVFEYGETLASPLVKVELLDSNNTVVDFTISNLQGNFTDLIPDNSNWRLQVKDGNFYYPIGDEKPKQLGFWQFYQGQAFNDENYQGQPILIPTLRASGQEKLPFFERLRIITLYLLNYPIWFLVLSMLIAGAFAVRYPSMFNSATLIFYFSIVGTKLLPLIKRQKSLKLLANLSNGQKFNGNLIVSLFAVENKLAQSMVLPFEFSQSQVIKHVFTDNVELTAFARDIALEKDDLSVANQELILDQKDQEITIQIKKS